MFEVVHINNWQTNLHVPVIASQQSLQESALKKCKPK